MKREQHILIVDDRPENLVALERVLGETSARVTAVSNGNDALAATLEHDFALAILDVQMPDMDGYELAELLRSEPKTAHLPIIFVSAVFSDDYHVFRGYQAGAVDFLTKPYKPEILLNKVRFFLLLDAQHQQLQEKLEIQQSKNYLESILTCMTDSIVVVAADDRIQMANRAARELLGYEENELVGAPLSSLFPDGSMPADLTSMGENASPNPRRNHEVRFVDKGGREIPALLSASVLRDGRSKAKGMVLAARDNTDQERAEKVRNELEAQLRHSQRMESLGQLAGGVAHDFNNLLTVVMSCSSFAAEALRDGDPVRAEVDRTMEAAERAKDLVQQLLAFGHKQLLHPEVVDLNETVTTTTHMLERVLGEEVELEVMLASGRPQAFVDPGQLTQVLVNLAVNARDAMPQGGTLFISTDSLLTGAAENGFARVTVRDTGCGMKEEIRGRIFEPFFTTKGIGQGTGLGLSVVHGIIEQSKGRIAVESAPGAGATFTVDLPCPAPGLERKTQRATPAQTSTNAATVLIVEDDAAVREVVVRILQHHGYEVLAARLPQEATNLAARHCRIDLLLTDVVMPECSGPEVARTLRTDDPDLPVLLMSGHPYDAIDCTGITGERTAILQKPFTPTALVTKVREILHDA